MVHLSPSIGVLGGQKVCVSEQTVILPWRRLAAEKAVCRMLLSIGIRLKCEKAVIPLGSGTKILDTGNFFFLIIKGHFVRIKTVCGILPEGPEAYDCKSAL